MTSAMDPAVIDKDIPASPTSDEVVPEWLTIILIVPASTDCSGSSDTPNSLPTDDSNTSDSLGSRTMDGSNPSNLSESLSTDESKPSNSSTSIPTDNSNSSDLSQSILTDDSNFSDLPESLPTDDSSFLDSPESLSTDDTCYSCSHTRLETLPAEIRFQILSFLDYKDLKALVQASSIYHEQYLFDRRLLLFGCLENTLAGILFEACVVHETSSLEFTKARTPDNVFQLCQSLEERRFSSRSSALPESLTQDDAENMMAFHFNVIKPFARHYAEWALSNLAKEPEASHTKLDEPLSESEELRIIRALYRFHICCNVFGLGPYKDHIDCDYQQNLFADPLEILQFLEDLYDPWELEELHCINIFAEEKCTEIIESIVWDFNEYNPKFDRQARPYTPEGAIDIRTYEDNYMKGILTQGLGFLHKILYEVQDHSELVSIIEKNLTICWGDFLSWFSGAFDRDILEERRHRTLSEKDRREERRDPLPFRGDIVDNMDGGYPPLAWTIIWKGTYSNMIGGECPRLSDWGYVMWDAARLERTGAKEVMARQWNRMWGENEDPRDQPELF